MTIIFWFISACMLVLALAFVLLPLLRHQQQDPVDIRRQLNIQVRKEQLRELQRDFELQDINEQEFNSAKQELEAGLLTDINDAGDDSEQAVPASRMKTMIPIAVALPLFVIVAYLYLGDIKMLDPETSVEPQQADQEGMHSIEEMVESLNAKLQLQPDNGEGWVMLARSYLVLNKPKEAVDAYKNARIYIGDDPRLLADYSEALVLANNNTITEEVETLVRLSLDQNPLEPKSLWIAGYISVQQGELAKTLQYWEKLLTVLPEGSKESKSLQENINQVRQSAGMTGDEKGTKLAQAAMEAAESTAVPVSDTPITAIDVQVNLASTLLEKANPEDTVFIFARASEGPRMPLAIARKQVKDLPVKVTLDDSMAMSPAMSLSKFKQVVIGARVSKTGGAMPQSGDLSGTSNVIQLSEVLGVKVTIDQVLP